MRTVCMQHGILVPPMPSLQILGSRKAVTALANLLPIHIPLTADLLNALVVLCSSSPSHVRMMLDAGALPWLLAFAAGSSTPSADPLNRRGAATAPVAGPGVPADDWPIVRMFAAELLDMVGDMVDERSGTTDPCPGRQACGIVKSTSSPDATGPAVNTRASHLLRSTLPHAVQRRCLAHQGAQPPRASRGRPASLCSAPSHGWGCVCKAICAHCPQCKAQRHPGRGLHQRTNLCRYHGGVSVQYHAQRASSWLSARSMCFASLPCNPLQHPLLFPQPWRCPSLRAPPPTATRS